ncbi:hypothetical protein M3197_06505 [Sporosarcina aquimarina]|nr:hypothetical protein [Sporosarcina aquimarina]
MQIREDGYYGKLDFKPLDDTKLWSGAQFT